MQPRADVCRKLFRMEALGLRRCFLSGEGMRCRSENRDAGAEQMEKVPACQVEFVNGIFAEFKPLRLGNKFIGSFYYRSGSPGNFAAFNTAFIIRGCAPQRH